MSAPVPSPPGRAGTRRAVAIALAALLCARAAVAGTDRAALLDTGRDVIVDRAFVPSSERPQGEVRVVRRADVVVVQTILYTRALKRVVGAIVGKEQRNWPPGSAGHDDMRRYVDALEAYRRAAAPAGGDGAGSGRRVQALIEFIDAPGAPFVAIGGVTLDDTGGTVRVTGRAAPAVPALSADYVRRNMALIVADSFAVSPAEAEARLAAAAGR
jgi:hypothetical protein